MGDLQRHFENEHSDCLPENIPYTSKEDNFDVEEIGVVAKNYRTVAKSRSGGSGNKKKKCGTSAVVSLHRVQEEVLCKDSHEESC